MQDGPVYGPDMAQGPEAEGPVLVGSLREERDQWDIHWLFALHQPP